MSENNDPVAQVPEASNFESTETPQVATGETNSEKTSLHKRNWPWFVVVGVAAITGLTGYALGHTNGEGNRHQPPIGLNGPIQGGPNGGQRGIDPDGDNWSGGGKHRQQGPQAPGLPGMPGQPGAPGLPGGPGFGPHCEDSTGAHAPVNADGSCPTGFTLDDKGPGQQLVPNAPVPTSSTPSPTNS